MVKAPDPVKSGSPLSIKNVASGVVLLLAVAYFAAQRMLPSLLTPEELQPLNAPRLVNLPQFSPQYKDSMLWGSYRPGLYFGMRTRAPKSLLTGLMWFDPDVPETLMQQRVRHAASQDDRLPSYGWTRHDGRTWGRQVIVDDDFNITLTMVKHGGEEGTGVGGDWAVRINVTRRDGSGNATPRKQRQRVSFVMYIADEDVPKTPWQVMPHGESDGLREPTKLVMGSSNVIGPWSLHMTEVGPMRKRMPARLDYLAMPAIEGQHDFKIQVRELMMSIMYEHMERNPATDAFHMYLPNGVTTGSDLALFQVTVPIGAVVDWVFLSHGGPSSGPAVSDNHEARVAALSGASLTALISQRDQDFEERFQSTFGGRSGAEQPSSGALEVSKAALSNLLGSMGYFHGSSKVRVASGKVAPYWPASLFTAVPSRSFFPRGFLWDEGFHQLLVHRWDPLLSRDVIAHWLDLLNVKGWIPREQILGKEAEMRVPAEFMVQDPAHANPPSLFLPISAMARQLSGENGHQVSEGEVAELRAFLSAAWPRLEVWYRWFNTTQAGEEPTSYRWRGRNDSTPYELNPKTLTSGLDDFPRASHPTSAERHLDLRCWMALASQAMAMIGKAIELPTERIAPYQATHAALSDMVMLDQLHWNKKRGQYLDWGMHTESVRLERHSYTKDNGAREDVMVRTVGAVPKARHVPHFGYVSLFPLLMRVLPVDSPRLGALLLQLNDTKLLWTPSGLRSLAASSSLYRQYNTEHDPPYWRGQIWMNINYLALSALRHYSDQPGPHAEHAEEVHAALQAALTQNVVHQYRTRGYLFEQYDDVNGKGTSSHPFTGWTALITLIATGTY